MFEIHSPHFTTMECLNVSGTNMKTSWYASLFPHLMSILEIVAN